MAGCMAGVLAVADAALHARRCVRCRHRPRRIRRCGRKQAGVRGGVLCAGPQTAGSAGRSRARNHPHRSCSQRSTPWVAPKPAAWVSWRASPTRRTFHLPSASAPTWRRPKLPKASGLLAMLLNGRGRVADSRAAAVVCPALEDRSSDGLGFWKTWLLANTATRRWALPVVLWARRRPATLSARCGATWSPPLVVSTGQEGDGGTGPELAVVVGFLLLYMA